MRLCLILPPKKGGYVIRVEEIFNLFDLDFYLDNYSIFRDIINSLNLDEDIIPAIKKNIFKMKNTYYLKEWSYKLRYRAHKNKAYKPKLFKRITYTHSNRYSGREKYNKKGKIN